MVLISQREYSTFLTIQLLRHIIQNRNNPASNPCTDRVLFTLERHGIVYRKIGEPVNFRSLLVNHNGPTNNAGKTEQIYIRAGEINHGVTVLLNLNVTDL